MMMERIQPQISRKPLEGFKPDIGIVIYICPTEGCENYYASTTFRTDRSNIEEMQFARNQNTGTSHSTHNRIECPDCRERGMAVQRVPYIITEVVSLEKAMEELRNASG